MGSEGGTATAGAGGGSGQGSSDGEDNEMVVRLHRQLEGEVEQGTYITLIMLSADIYISY